MDLTVDPHNKVDSHEHHVIVSTRYGVSIICTNCGYLRNMFPFDGTTHVGLMATGEVFRQCYCTQPLVEYPPLQVVQR